MRKSFFVGAVLGLLTLVLWVGPASAHAGLSGSDPGDGASLQSLPSTISFTFTENIGNAFVAVTAPDGTTVETSEPSAVDRSVSVEGITDPGQQGVYSASYRVVSSDGHPVAGTITFTVLTGEEVDQVTAAESTPEQGFLDRHLGHVLWGTAAGVVAIFLIVLPLRRRDDPHDA